MAISAWSQASRKVHFFWLPIPAYAFLPFALTLFHVRIWTVSLTLVVVGVLGFLSWKGRRVEWILRRARLRLRMGGMQARPLWYRRRMQTLCSLDVVPIASREEAAMFTDAPVSPAAQRQKGR